MWVIKLSETKVSFCFSFNKRTELFAYVISGEWRANRPKKLQNEAFHVKTSRSTKNELDPTKSENRSKTDIRLFAQRLSIGHVRYFNILTWLSGFQVKFLYLVLFSLYSSLFWELRDKRNLKNLQFWPESLKAMLEYSYIKRGLLWSTSKKTCKDVISNPRLIIDYRYFVWQLSMYAAYLVGKKFHFLACPWNTQYWKIKSLLVPRLREVLQKAWHLKLSHAQPDNHMQGCMTSKGTPGQYKTNEDRYKRSY